MFELEMGPGQRRSFEKKLTGHGVGGIPYSMREMTHEKMRVIRYPAG